MKNKNLLWLGAIGIGIYYLLKKDNTSNPKTSENTITTDKRFSFTKEDLEGGDRTINITEDVGILSKRMGISLSYKMPYRGGARPSRFMEETSGMWIVSGNAPELKTRTVCPNEAFELSLNANGSKDSNCVKVASTKDVIDYIFNNSSLNWLAEFGERIKKRQKGDALPMGALPMGMPQKAFPTGMSKYGSNLGRGTYSVPSGISL
tara:strand:+ start:3317 stop:3934 length:618 start_codon:yes stop_codon:yes gene_type:complete